MDSKGDDINEGSALSMLWVNIITERKLINRLDGLLINYHNRYKPKKGETSTIKKKSLHAIKMDAYGKTMTWKALVNLIFNVLRAKSFRLIVEINWDGNNKSAHEITILKNPIKEESNGNSESGVQKQAST